MTRFDRYTEGRLGRILIGIVLFMVINAGLAGWALTTAWNAKGREIAIAQQESARAVAKAQQAEDAQRVASARALESARLGFCAIINLIAAPYPPPTNARSAAVQQAFRTLGQTAFLHCGTK